MGSVYEVKKHQFSHEDDKNVYTATNHNKCYI